MKKFGNFNWDGYNGSIELLRFLDGITDDLLEAICTLIGSSAVFIKGGLITESSGETTITAGIICYNNKLYTYEGGTHAGTPATLKMLFEENTDIDFPKVKFQGDPILKDIYLNETCRIDATGTVFLNAIGSIYDLQTLKTSTDLIPTKAGKNAYIDISSSIVVNGAFSVISKIAREYEDGTIYISVLLTHTTTIALNTAILSNIPNIGYMIVNAISVAATTRNVKDIYCVGTNVTNYFTTIAPIATPPLVTNLGFTIIYKK